MPPLPPLPLAAAILISLGYVLLLYVPPFRSSLPRDHPSTITRRTAACLVSCALAPLPLLWLSSSGGRPLLLLGLAPPHPLRALLAPPALALLPYLPGLLFSGRAPSLPLRSRAALFRDLLVAPLAEEWCYRACLLPLLLLLRPLSSPAAAVWTAPLFFSLAHAHHHFAGVVNAESASRASTAALVLLIQLAYTYVFGAFAAHMLLATGSFWGVAAAHALCNLLGLPSVGCADGTKDKGGRGAARRIRHGLAIASTVLATGGMVAGVVAARQGSDRGVGGGLLLLASAG